MKSRRLGIGLLGLTAALLCPGNAQAGNGTVDPNGDITLNVHFTVPPLPDHVTQLEEQMTRANSILCDATDGKLRIKTVNVSIADGKEDSADIIWYPQGGRAFSTGNLGSGRVTVYRYGGTNSSMRGDVIAHELGHHILGLGDSYSMQRESWTCASGPSFDGELFQGRGNYFDRQLPGPDTERNHSIMQQAGAQVCARPTDGMSPGKINPMEFGDRGCLTDADCSGAFDVCPVRPMLMSELSAVNPDPVRGTGVNSCPAPLAGTEIAIRGRVELRPRRGRRR